MIQINSKKTITVLGVSGIATMLVLLVALSGNDLSSLDQNTVFRRNLNKEAESIKIRDDVCLLLPEDVDPGKLVNQDQRDSWENNRKTMQNSRDENYLEEYMAGRDSDLTPFVISVVMYAAVFLAFCILSLIGFICYIMCCVCEKCCPPCKLCGKCKEEKAYVGFEKFWPAVGSVVMSLEIFIVCCIGFSYSAGLEESFEVFSCGGLIAFHGIMYGGGSFLGVVYLKEGLEDWIKVDLGKITDGVTETFTGTPAWVTKEKQVMDSIADSMEGVCAAGPDCGQLTSCGNTDENDGPLYPLYLGNTAPEEFELKLAGENAATTFNTGEACAGQDWDANGRVDWDYAANPEDSNSNTEESVFFGSNGAWNPKVTVTREGFTAAAQGVKAAIDGMEESALALTSTVHLMRDAFLDGLAAMETFELAVLDLMSTIRDFHMS